MIWMGHVAHMAERRDAYRVLVWKTEGKTWKTRHRLGDNIKMDLQEVGGGMDWTDLAQTRDRWWAVVNTVINLWVP
jgi:hypothetical protein